MSKNKQYLAQMSFNIGGQRNLFGVAAPRTGDVLSEI